MGWNNDPEVVFGVLMNKRIDPEVFEKWQEEGLEEFGHNKHKDGEEQIVYGISGNLDKDNGLVVISNKGKKLVENFCLKHGYKYGYYLCISGDYVFD